MKKSFITLSIMFILVAANSGMSNQPASYSQMQQVINATNSPMPINDMVKARGKVNQAQQQYKNARELQYKQQQQYENMYK